MRAKSCLISISGSINSAKSAGFVDEAGHLVNMEFRYEQEFITRDGLLV